MTEVKNLGGEMFKITLWNGEPVVMTLEQMDELATRLCQELQAYLMGRDDAYTGLEEDKGAVQT